ncbi:MAG: lipase family protein [Solirubrobacteraceae bacterium]|nr:lipase family protein [Patulibacter sp.]
MSTIRPLRAARRVLGTAPILACAAASAPAAALASPADNPFYQYTGSAPLSSVAPGTVLRSRTINVHLFSIKTPIKTVQLLYRSTSQTGAPTVNVTSVLLPPRRNAYSGKLISYQSAYDSLDPRDEPSYQLAGNVTFGGLLSQLENSMLSTALLTGYTIAIPDTEGQQADFADGPEYGMNTLDALRATFSAPETGLTATSKAAMIGYSGGAIATQWAAQMAPTYAPDVNARLVGAAMGGVLVDPAHNLDYVSGSKTWAGVAPMAIIGTARAFGVDMTPYLSAYGLKIYAKLQKAPIAAVLAQYPGLTWKQLAKPEYPTASSVKLFVDIANQVIMGHDGHPTIPLYIGQGAHGETEGTAGDKPGIGEGDGVMIAGDVRQLAYQYCSQGVPVYYREYPNKSHTSSTIPWAQAAIPWMLNRFGKNPSPSNCSLITPGNPLTPMVYTPAVSAS